MKLVRFAYDGKIQNGVWENGRICIIHGNWFGSWEKSGETLPLASVRLLAPVDPVSILCVGKNYLEHAHESDSAAPKAPLLFLKAKNAVCGPDDIVSIPRTVTKQVDYEAELAVVIGKKAYRVAPEKAAEYILGYTCADDVSARDCQFGDEQWARGKSLDHFCPLGPWIETSLNVDDLAITGRLNGRVMQRSRTSMLIFKIPEIISYFSQGMTLLPGTVILTGTPAGCGFARTPPVWLRAGDVYEVEIEGIGRLRNTFDED